MSKTDEAVCAHLETVESEIRRRHADTLLELMARITGEEPRMWGPSIIGFGSYHYKYASGREGDAPAAGFSPHKAATSVYLTYSSRSSPSRTAQLRREPSGSALPISRPNGASSHSVPDRCCV